MFGLDLKIEVKNPMGDVERLVGDVGEGDRRLWRFGLEPNQIGDENGSSRRASYNHRSRPFP